MIFVILDAIPDIDVVDSKPPQTRSKYFLTSGTCRDPSHPHLAGVLAAAPVAGAHHLVVDDDVDAVALVPLLTQPVVDDGHVHGLQGLGPQARTWRADEGVK